MTPPVGLRERKKEETRRALVRHGLRLFLEQGFEATTVEQITAAANVAPRTFFRYFATKEDLLGWNQEEEDRVLRQVLAVREPGEDDVTCLARALDALMRLEPEGLEESSRFLEVILKNDALKARTLEELLRVERLLADGLLAGRPATAADRLRVRMLAAAAVSIYMAALVAWVEGGRQDDVRALLAPGIGYLRGGFVG